MLLHCRGAGSAAQVALWINDGFKSQSTYLHGTIQSQHQVQTNNIIQGCVHVHVCVCQTLFQRVIHSRFQQQGGNLVSIAGCPTKRAMPRLIWRLIISTYLLLRPRKPYKCVPPEEWGCCRYLYRLVMTCFKKTTFCRLIALQLSLMPELEQSSII